MRIHRVAVRSALALSIIILGTIVAGGVGGDAEQAEERRQRVPIVRVAAARSPDGTRTVSYPGVVASADAADVGTLVAGRVAEVHVETGDSVARDSILVSIDGEGYRLARGRAAAERARAVVQLEQAQRDLTRVRALGSAATEEEQEQRSAAVADAAAALDQAQSAVAEAERRLRETTVRAPWAGVITDVLVDRGEIVATGTPVAVVSTTETVKNIELVLSFEHARGLRIGDQARVFPAIAALPAAGATVVSISDHGRPSDSLFPVRLSLGTGGSLPPGTPVTVELHLAESFGDARIPAAAVSGVAAGETFSYRVRNGTVTRVALAAVQSAGDGYVLAQGPIAPGDLVVISGHDNIADGGAVEVIR